MTGMDYCRTYTIFVGTTAAGEAALSDPIKINTLTSTDSLCTTPAPCRCVGQPDGGVFNERYEQEEDRVRDPSHLKVDPSHLTSCDYGEL
jgi:hypothetical protein